jgi:hypothetical protein
MAWGCWNKAEAIANAHKNEDKPFYIVFTAKVDPSITGNKVEGLVAFGGIRQTFKLCYERPPMILGALIWYVDNKKGIFEFVPQLSSPPDIPLDESLLSTESRDFIPSIANKAQAFDVRVS